MQNIKVISNKEATSPAELLVVEFMIKSEFVLPNKYLVQMYWKLCDLDNGV